MNWRPGPMRQNGIVVADIDAAIRYWTETMRVGPFFRIADQPLVDFMHRGHPSSARISVALAQSGGIQIELVQPLDDEPSAFNDYRRRVGEGLQHVAFWTDEFDSLDDRARRSGLIPVQWGRSGSGGSNERFAYFETPDAAAPMIEISETLGRKALLFAKVARAAEGWDGADPVRDMSELVR